MRRSGRRWAGLAVLLPPAIAIAGPAAAAQPGAILRELLSTGLALVVVCLLAYVSVRVMRRMGVGGGASPPGGEPRFVRALPLGQHERLVVVEWRGETLLLGVTAGSVIVLDRSERSAGPEARVADGAESEPFRSVLDRARKAGGLRASPRQGVP